MVDKILKLIKDIKSSPFFDKQPNLPKKPLNEHDYEFMNSLSSAVLQIRPTKIHFVLLVFVFTFFFFIIWASFAQIDELVRGTGIVVPSGQNQIIQNLEGGVVSEILVKEGQMVHQDQILIRISNEKSSSNLMSSSMKVLSLEAQVLRLEAELNKKDFNFEPSEIEEMNTFLENEKNLFLTNKQQITSKVQILEEQLKQKQNELVDLHQNISHLEFSLDMISKEVGLTKPMVEKGIRSQVDFLKLQREESDAKQKYQSAKLSINKINSEIAEIKKRIDEIYQTHDSELREKLNEVVTNLKELQANSIALEDQVSRTIVKSPLNGIVQKLHINTIGGAIKPAQDLIEIVPTDYTLLIEAKIKPADIAFIYLGQKAIVKFSAYDFSIYGGLEGHVVNISPDTITEKDDQKYYLVRVETEDNYIGNKSDPLKIIPGMTSDVDIITGKKSIMDYILKPILKTKQYTFTER
ncbi:MAG: HlyD family type I secretion periplasmic adaptor subunit [Arcobacteraceae bacterium]|nr:HlyD family type I secretion periplasmic adaptor subunit [Arcobacteraceae bacterium]MDY0327986.1 HlyD family type I secretion periplasmic adaptor subunit [Arcobacteraceae bacterium]